ncbi:hypothetical protein [Arthrobacter sp. StoSoilB13]|uniref:hypothetical protein n=1 Tax=Arthrobacter sp. StoSoilB13 TaxID=2830993 RepID=UPI001CC4A792|nr:hypothetical protein [Arthrobacter sp. StoSoilB13]BCW52184.1 hypothetical protein StoSoilB13_45260 [Arthrobacter sp. StoSoilB13]
MLLPRLGALTGLLALLLCAAVPANAQEGPSGWLELDAGPTGEVHRLTPGGTADWAVDVHARGEGAGLLEVWIQPTETAGPDSESRGLRDYLSVQLRSCEQPWNGAMCASGERSLLEPTGLHLAEGLRIDLMKDGSTWSNGSHILVSAALTEDVPAEFQGGRTQIVLGVLGSGDAAGDSVPGAVTAGPGGPPSSIGLADTGARLGGAAMLGLLAVATGFALARLRGAQA